MMLGHMKQPKICLPSHRLTDLGDLTGDIQDSIFGRISNTRLTTLLYTGGRSLRQVLCCLHRLGAIAVETVPKIARTFCCL